MEPKLQKPGAGLPFIEHWMTRLMLPRWAKKVSWEDSVRRFDKQTEKILALVGPLDLERLQKRVLVSRIQGLEDSSRYWSAAMTLEHLIVAAGGMSQIALELSQEKNVAIEIDIAKIKPKAALDPVRAREIFAEEMKKIHGRVLNDVKNRESRKRHRHPWFGGLTAHQWVFLLAAHQNVHRKQIEAIVRGL